MSSKASAILAAVLSLALVAGAEIISKMPGWDDFALPVLFPGYILNLLLSGVHGSWDSFFGKCVRLVPSAVMWFGLFFLVIWALFKKRPIQPPVPTRGNGT